MKNISKIAAMLLIGGSFVIQSCDGVFDDLAINPNQRVWELILLLPRL